MADEPKTKAVEGSFEHLRDSVQAAVQASGLFGDHAWVTNTFADSAVVCTYGEGKPPAHFRVGYTVNADGSVALGAAEPVAIAEVVVTSAADAAENTAADDVGGEYADDDLDAKADGAVQHKTLDFELKAVGEDQINGVKGWTFEGYATVWNVVDRENDVTIKGAFTRWLAENGLPVAKHEHGPTVGKYLDAREDDHGLWLKGFVPEDPQTELLHKLMKIGAVAKMSIGWRPYPGGMTKRADGVRELRSIMLPEASIVAVPMLPATQITSVKSGVLPDAKFDERIEAATAALNEAVADAGALVARRTAQDRAPSAKSLDAIAALAVASGDALVGLVTVETKAGRALSGVRKRHLADLAKAVGAILASLPEAEREEIEALIDGGAAGEGTETGGGKADAAAGAARRREAELYELKLQRYARQAPAAATL